MSNLYTAKELKERISKNDNRCTASPYLLLLREKTEVVVHEDFYYNGQKWVEYLTGDYLTNEKREALVSDLLEYGYDKSEIEKKGSIEEYFYREVNETINVFLTDEGYRDHLEANGHNIRKHDTFGVHAFRNKEIASLLNLIDVCIENDKKIEKLQAENKKLREALERSLSAANFFSSHADCQRDSWACKCSFCKNSGLHCKEIRDSEKILKELARQRQGERNGNDC